jgi:small subunit ribosomal protein S21
MLKKKMQREGLFKEMKKRKHFIKPSEEKVLRAEESMRRRRKARSRREGE